MWNQALILWWLLPLCLSTVYIKQMGTKGRRPRCLCPWFRLPVRAVLFEEFSGVPSPGQSVFKLCGLEDQSSDFVQSLSEKGWKFIFTLLFCFLLYQPRILLMFSISIPPPLLELDCYWSVSPLTRSLSSNCVPESPGHGSVRSSPAPSTDTGLMHCPVCFLGLHSQDYYTEWVKYPSRAWECSNPSAELSTGCKISVHSLNSLCIWICSLKMMLCTNMQMGLMTVVHYWLLIVIRHHWTTVGGW